MIIILDQFIYKPYFSRSIVYNNYVRENIALWHNSKQKLFSVNNFNLLRNFSCRSGHLSYPSSTAAAQSSSGSSRPLFFLYALWGRHVPVVRWPLQFHAGGHLRGVGLPLHPWASCTFPSERGLFRHIRVARCTCTSFWRPIHWPHCCRRQTSSSQTSYLSQFDDFAYGPP